MISSIAIKNLEFKLIYIICLHNEMVVKCAKGYNSSIYSIDNTISFTIPGQCGSESKDNEGIFNIPQNSWTVASPSDGFVTLIAGGFYPSAVKLTFSSNSPIYRWQIRIFKTLFLLYMQVKFFR